ncbi:MAG: endo-1,4-beta-xylanase [Anaerocolumna sp.]
MLLKGKNTFRKFLGFTLSLLMFLTIAIPTSTVQAATTKTYNFNSMTYQSTWGVTYSISNGSATFNFTGQYREIKFNLPETLDMSKCTSVTFNASSPNGPIAFKLYDTAGTQAAVNYNFNSGTSDCTFTPNSTSQVNSIGIMAQGTSSYSATVKSVKFTMTDSPSGTATLLDTYGNVLQYSGAAVNSSQLNNATTLNVIKTQYNSITMENEMKPDAVLGSSPALISVSQAEANGYYIPSGYTESTVPNLNFGTIDSVLQTCYNNGLKLRAHTLVWHGQTPSWFFRTGYSSSGSYVSQAVMDARMEMYIKTYMNHVYLGDYGSVVYAWDVVNEYLHASSSGWSAIYGSNLGTTPSYVKKAFQYAHDCLSYFGLTDSVSLFYNDYNTYEVADNIVSLVNFINSGTKLCNGVGMQSHLNTSYPSVSAYKSAMQKFLNAGFEVQLTELDVGNTSASAQASYTYDLMSAILALKNAGGNITGTTWWGLYDSVSWRSSSSPLLFSNLTTPKTSYYSALQAYMDAGYSVQ